MFTVDPSKVHSSMLGWIILSSDLINSHSQVSNAGPEKHLISMSDFEICNSYTMGCPPERGDNPRALASGLSYEQVDKHVITILYTPTSV